MAGQLSTVAVARTISANLKADIGCGGSSDMAAFKQQTYPWRQGVFTQAKPMSELWLSHSLTEKLEPHCQIKSAAKRTKGRIWYKAKMHAAFGRSRHHLPHLRSPDLIAPAVEILNTSIRICSIYLEIYDAGFP
jgi:hypothetical protein